ncbi:hypothetical protein CO659_13355 [Rhizobium sp. S9]|nr:hypothetical protein CO659_13355 [Rhizobium sp. S9]
MPTDNNILKRDIRVIATARNSWLFRDTVDGPRPAPWAPDRRSTRPRQKSRDVRGPLSPRAKRHRKGRPTPAENDSARRGSPLGLRPPSLLIHALK